MTTLSDNVIKYLAKDLVCKIWKLDIFHIHFKLIFRKCAYAYNLEKCHTKFVSVYLQSNLAMRDSGQTSSQINKISSQINKISEQIKRFSWESALSVF